MKSKTILFIYLIVGSFITILPTISLMAQTGIQCVWCGGMNGHHNPGCRYLTGNVNAGSSSGMSLENQVMGAIFSNMLNGLFNSNTNSKPSQEEELRLQREEQLRQQRLAQMQERINRYNDSVKQAKHDRMMKDYKKIDNGNSSELKLKQLPNSGAPLTQEERERQFLVKKNINVTWNFNEFNNIQDGKVYDEKEIENQPTQEEKVVNEMIAKVEDNGGKLAAITGRYMINLKDGVFNYTDDALSAIRSGNSAIMMEVGEMDVRKISTNAIYKTAKQTAEVYYEKIKSAGTQYLKDKSIGVMTGEAIEQLQKVEYTDNLIKAWQQIQ